MERSHHYGADYFLPGIGVDKSTSGSSAHIGLVYYYYYPVSNCNTSTCQLNVGFTSSTNSGSTWTCSDEACPRPSATQLAGPMKVTWLAATTGGNMVGDYFSTTIINGKAYPVFIVAKAPNGTKFKESAYTAIGGLAMLGGRNSSASDHSYPVTPRPTSRVGLTAY